MTSLYLITHNHIGAELIKACQATFEQLPLTTECLSIHKDDDPQSCLRQATIAVERLGQHGTLLVLTDVFGATPSNIAHQLDSPALYAVLTGVNLGMLFKLYNYSHLKVEDLCAKALAGAAQGIQLHLKQLEESV